MELFFDTETSGKFNFKSSYKSQDQPWVVQLGMILSTQDDIFSEMSFLIQSDGRKITDGAFNVHKIFAGECDKYGITEGTSCYLFLELLMNANTIVCHNVSFDRLMIANLLYRNRYKGEAEFLMNYDSYCTMQHGTDITRIPHRGRYKWPTLQELYYFLFNNKLEGAHDALVDTRAMRKCYYSMTGDIPF